MSVRISFRICCLLMIIMQWGYVKAKQDHSIGTHVVEYIGINTQVQVCGRSLTNLMFAVCNGKFTIDNTKLFFARLAPVTLSKPRRESPASLCCSKSCKLRDLKIYCSDQSISGDLMPMYWKNRTTIVPLTTTSTTTASTTTTPAPTTTSTTTTTTTTPKPELKPFYYPARWNFGFSFPALTWSRWTEKDIK